MSFKEALGSFAVIETRFEGPPGIVNGGYAAGLLLERFLLPTRPKQPNAFCRVMRIPPRWNVPLIEQRWKARGPASRVGFVSAPLARPPPIETRFRLTDRT